MYTKKHLLFISLLLFFCIFLSATAASNKKKIVLAGSSSIVYWTNAKSDLYPHKVINEGIRGSTAYEWNKKYYKRIIKKNPDVVILFVGGNDFKNSEVSGKTVANRIKKMIVKIHKELPKTKIYYVSINPTPKGYARWDIKSECNEAMRKYCVNTKRVIYINTAKYCIKKSLPNTKLYRLDGVHLNSIGYKKVWKNVVAKIVKKDLS